jgi:Ca-activated chloride channel homolog
MGSGADDKRTYIFPVAATTRRLAAAFSALILACLSLPAGAQEPDVPPCTEDAMLVFDASGSMSSDGWGYTGQSTGVSRIDLVRSALQHILPSITRARRVGLMTYGPTAVPSLFNQCDNIALNLRPTPNAAAPIMASVQSLVPVGGTPLTRAVEQSAEVLDFRHKPGVIVVLTDGWDTCGGAPCGVGKVLHAAAAQLTIHVISLKAKGLSRRDEQRLDGMRCLAAYNGGLYLSPETPEELTAALERTLGCPMVSRDEGGDAGGKVVATGTPEEVAKVASSYTGQYLKQLLDKRGGASSRGKRPAKAEAAE